MEAIKNFVVIDDCYNWMDNENFKAIPDKYKTLNIYMTYGRADGGIEKMREHYEWTEDGSVADSLCVITDTVDGFMDGVKGRDRMLIIKWLFDIFEDQYVLDVETGAYSKIVDEE